MMLLSFQAFFASDGRSKKQQPLLEETKPKYTCTECGKNYATSSNLSRHRQTHRTLDSTNAKKCPICNKVGEKWISVWKIIKTDVYYFRCMSACQHCRCTYWPITFLTSATCVVKLSLVPGSCRDTWDLTLEISHMAVLIVVNLLLTGERHSLEWLS